MPIPRIEVVRRLISEANSRGSWIKANKYENELSILELDTHTPSDIICETCGKVKYTTECAYEC